MAIVNKRATKTVKTKKKKYVYEYRIGDTYIRLSGKGYQAHAKLTKLQFKSGKLTKAGEELLAQINQIQQPALKRYMLQEFEAYRKDDINRQTYLTLERWESHLIQDKLTRMIYNLGTTPQEIADQLNQTVNGLNLTASDVLQLNWDFQSNTVSDGVHTWDMQFDYQAYNGFKFVLV